MVLRIGVDVGGTFTDVTGYDDEKGAIAVRKYTSNPADPLLVTGDILAGLKDDFGADAIGLFLHGSTAALNTLLEDRGVRTGLLTTAGFRDVYEIGRQWRGDDVFNLFAPAPKMLVPRERIFEVRERLDFSGNSVRALEPGDVEAAVQALVKQEVQAIAICFLFAYANPAHEQAAAEIVRKFAPHIYVSLSSEVNPQWREYERTSSTVANAYIGPPTAHYLGQLEQQTRSYFPAARTLMMKSEGGAGTARMLAQKPIQTVMSGPVAGVIGARYLGDVTGRRNILTFDAGGTSSDMALLPGDPLFKTEVAIGRNPLRTETVDIETIGAGGGSIAAIALGGVLKVGPRSAGALPGPACYDRGGSQPTLTDALVALNHFNNEILLDGEMAIDGSKARDAIEIEIATPLNMSLRDASWGIVTVLVANCTAAMRQITIERGYDPREFTLVPFGGMGPAIAGRLAPELGVSKILIPRDPGAFSAWGMLVADVRQERSLTKLMALDTIEAGQIENLFRQLENEVVADLQREKFSGDQIQLQRVAGLRYRGQSYEVSVTAGAFANADDIDGLAQAFHAAHERRYGHMASNETIEIVTIKSIGSGKIDRPRLTKQTVLESAVPDPVGTRHAWFGSAGERDIPVFHRSALTAGMRFSGPAIVEEKTATTVIYPEQNAHVDEYLNIGIECNPAL